MDAIELIQWECAFFGRKIAKLDVNTSLPDAAAMDAYCRREHIELVQACVSADDKDGISALEKRRFQFVDFRLLMACDVTQTAPVERSAHMRLSTEADIPKLLQVCHHSFTEVSRYNWQGFFTDSQIDAFYDTWLENGVRGQHDDFCLHYQEGDNILGFATVKVNGGDAYIGIIAVGNGYRGRGIGDVLVQDVFAYAREHKLSSVSSVTQGKNTPTQNLYRKQGLQVKSKESWYYKKVTGAV